MELTQIILGAIQTEKSEQLKTSARTYTIRVNPKATKVDVKKALKKYFDVDVTNVRVLQVRKKTRMGPTRKPITKRHASKRMLVTLKEGSKTLDLTQFSTTR